MSCSPFDLRDYFLQELPDRERRQVEAHVKTCSLCREELDRLGVTQAALFSLRDEEIPQRVAFVSDAVFEPSPWRRAWSGLWNSAPRLGFASAAMLSAALIVFALMRPAPPVGAPAPAIDRAALEANLNQRVQDAVQKAVAESEARQAAHFQEVMAASKRQNALERQALVARVDEYLDVAKKRLNTQFLASNEPAAVREEAR
jgi:anti-sigma factor RsiW